MVSHDVPLGYEVVIMNSCWVFPLSGLVSDKYHFRASTGTKVYEGTLEWDHMLGTKIASPGLSTVV